MASAPAIDSAPAIGIDLGTTYSCVGVYREGTVEIIANDHRNRTTPSYVAFDRGERFVGEAAKSQEALNPTNTVFDAKRLIGRLFDDDSVQSDMKHWPFEVVKQGGKPRIRVEHNGETKTFYPEEISAMILTKMKKVAEDYLGRTVTKAVITVPAHFNNSQRQATKDAATIAGLDVLRLISEPTSAALAYGLTKNRDRTWLENRSLLVFDLGGGTLDVSVVTIKDGEFDVIATAGDTHLGGNDFDKRMVDHFAKEFKRKHHMDLTASKSSLSHLRAACEMAKRALSGNNQANIDIPYLFEGVHFHSTISGERFDALNADLFRKCMTLVEKALSDANMERAYVQDVVLIGGSTRIPKIQILLQDFFDREELCKDINPDEAVAYGAAVQAAILNGDQFDCARKLRLQDVTPLSLGIGVVDPMEEVGHRRLIMNVILKRNTAIPTRCTKSFTTEVDNQTKIVFKVYEGEHMLTTDNYLLGLFTLLGIQIADIKVPSIDVTFVINSDGILNVSAVDRSTGANNQLTITNDKSRLSEEEIRRMVRDAEKFKEDNENQKSRIAAKMALEDCALRFMTKVESDTAKGKLSESYRKKVLFMVNDTLDWSDRNQRREIDEFEDMQRELTRIIQLAEDDGLEDKEKELENICELISA